MKRKHQINILVIASIILMVPLISTAKESVTGTIVGFNSLIYEKEAPIDGEDPRIRFEPDFVLLASNDNYYFLPNVPREIKAGNIYKTVKVTGTITDKYRSMDVDKFQIKKEKDFSTVWSKKMRQKELDDRYRR